VKNLLTAFMDAISWSVPLLGVPEGNATESVKCSAPRAAVMSLASLAASVEVSLFWAVSETKNGPM